MIVPESNVMRRVKRRVEKAVVTTTLQDGDDNQIAEGQMDRMYARVGVALQAQAQQGVGVSMESIAPSVASRILPLQASATACYVVIYCLFRRLESLR